MGIKVTFLINSAFYIFPGWTLLLLGYDWTLRNKHQWIFKRNSYYIFYSRKCILKTFAKWQQILSWPQSLKLFAKCIHVPLCNFNHEWQKKINMFRLKQFVYLSIPVPLSCSNWHSKGEVIITDCCRGATNFCAMHKCYDLWDRVTTLVFQYACLVQWVLTKPIWPQQKNTYRRLDIGTPSILLVSCEENPALGGFPYTPQWYIIFSLLLAWKIIDVIVIFHEYLGACLGVDWSFTEVYSLRSNLL